MAEDKEYTNENERVIDLLKTVRDSFSKGTEQSVRERQITMWKKYEYMWEGFTRMWWDSVAHDWRVFDVDATEGFSDQAAHFDKPINVFRPYLETIIAAMSVTVPPVRCIPDNADVEDDVLTAKGGTKISELIYKHNNAPLLWLHALYIHCTQGMVAAYNYTESDESYGSATVDKYKTVEEENTIQICPNCGKELEGPELQTAVAAELSQLEEFDPREIEKVEDYAIESGKTLCTECQQLVNPQLTKEKIKVRRLVGTTQQAKSRQCIEMYGGLNIEIPNYCKKQKDIPYLRFSMEKHYSQIMKEFPDLEDEKGARITSGPGADSYEVWGRLSPQLLGAYPEDTPTLSKYWFRPWSFNVLSDEKDRNLLKKKFPDGARVCFVNNCFASAKNESLDDHWTLTENPMSEYLHFEPPAAGLVAIQEVTSDLIALILQTIEHGVPQTFFDSKVLNAELYKKQEIAPGAMIPAQAKSGKSLQDGFYTVKTAALSAEVMPFGEKIQELGQFSSGALPSLYGGDQSNSSRTAAQYSMSKESSMQRLQISYRMINFWWKEIFGKVIPAYIKDMIADEYLVREQEGSYVNTIVRRAELSGKIGSVELESSDQLPITYGERRDIIINLMQSTNPQVLEALSDPSNLPLLAEAIGLIDFKLPGEDDREKQTEEIMQLIKEDPIGQSDPITGQMIPASSIEPEFDVDDHKIQAEVCRSWLVSEAGRTAKVMNQPGYMNVMLHMKAHIMMLQQLQVPAQVDENGQPVEQEQEEETIEQTSAQPMLNNYMESQNVQ